MNKHILWLLPLMSSAYAESRPLPPVIDNSVYQNGSAYGTAEPSNNVIYELLGRVEQLQREVQNLRGQVEEQGHVIEDLKKRQGNIYTDLDQRIQALTLPGQSTGSASAAVNQQSAKPVAEIQPPEAAVQTVKSSQQRQADEKQRYHQAYELLRNGHNSQAIKAFKDLIRDYPRGEYADNAQYWLGEAYKVNQQVDLARAAFLKLPEMFPKSPKVPDALLKLGYIELEQNNLAKARDYLTRVKVDYPGTTAAHLAGKKLMQLDQL